LTPTGVLPAPSLSQQVQHFLNDFLKASESAFGDKLRSVVLFGSAAEGKLRPTSDVNLVIVLSAFEQAQADCLREPLRLAHAAIQLRVMFLLAEEIPEAVRSFAPKMADILRRRVILFGDDPFATISVPRDVEIGQLKQQLLNITLRLRSVYVARSLREEQLARFIANSIGPLRGAAAALLALEGRTAVSPVQAFETLGAEFSLPNWTEALVAIASIQDANILAPGAVQRLSFQLIEFARLATARLELLSGEVRRESI
jgi:predicted nucleotidyltransferase